MQGETLHHVEIDLSDVDRGVYEQLDVRMARHPSESARFLATRLLAYALSWEEGIAFSKGGVSSTDEPPVSVRDATGRLLAWVDVGSPSAARLHKATKIAERVALFTCADVSYLERETIHRKDEIAVFALDADFVDRISGALERRTRLELVRNDGRLYVTVAGTIFEGVIVAKPLGSGQG